MDLLKRIREMKQTNTSTGAIRSIYQTDHDDEFRSEVDENDIPQKPNSEYAKKYIRKEEVLYQTAHQLPSHNPFSVIDSNSDLLSCAGRSEVNEIKHKNSCDVFKKYRFEKLSSKLPIDDYHDRIIQYLDAYDVMVIQGPTGCGKTTHVPQFILDDCKAKNKPCKIAVTQPRRIAAITVARRVCQERNWSLGHVCGYQVGLDKKNSKDSILTYVTTGVLLQQLIKQKHLRDYTHIIVDEVHERNQDMDFLLLVIRKFLNTNSDGVKVILMSATINTDEFSQYFKTCSQGEFSPAAVIQMSQKTFHNVQIFYSDQLIPIGEAGRFELHRPTIDKQTYSLFVKLIAALDKLDPIDSATNTSTIGNVLVFLPGIMEIEEAHDMLTTYNQCEQLKRKISLWHIIPLHSSLTMDEQRRVFQSPPEGMRKIILSTNIAESSITVPDILYVVDFCLTKTMIMDSKTQYQSLQLQWASHTHCNQRAGRVGRVADGRVYRLIPEGFYCNELQVDVIPEILRAPLHNLVLSAKMLNLSEPPKAILALTMNPPDLNNIDKTVLFLKEIGGLALTCKGVKLARDGDITFLGQVMAALPIDVRLAKFIVLGHIFSCLEDCIIMATGCSLSVFKTPFKDRLKSYINCLQWADNSTCDFIGYLNLYRVWQRQKQLNANSRQERDWCAKNYVNSRTLNEWNILVKEVKDRLELMNIKPSVDPGRVVLTDTEIPMIIKVVICGAFYPNYFKFPKEEGNLTEREAVKMLNGLDPFNTVYFTGFPSNQPGQLYARHIKEYFKDCASDMRVSFNNSSKVYVQFLNCNQAEKVNIGGQHFFRGMPGKIKVEVYRAIHLRQLNISCSFKVLEPNKAKDFAEKLGIDTSLNSSLISCVSKTESSSHRAQKSHTTVTTPSLDIEFLKITVVETIDGSNFWAHNASDDTSSTLEKIDKILNDNMDLVVTKTIDMSKHYTTQYDIDRLYYRCKVLEIKYNDSYHKNVKVLFIDYGTTAVVNSNKLFELPEHKIMKVAPLAFPCQLSEIQPSIVYNPKGVWSETVNLIVGHKLLNKTFFAQVYSVVNGVTCLELYNINEKEFIFQNSFNNWLISQGYGQHSKESFLSKENHLKRLNIVGNPEIWNGFAMDDVIADDCRDVAPPDSCICKNTIELKGPFSPLETNIFSIVGGGYSKKAKIDGTSVNCVTLDTNPEDLHERLIVAGTIHQTPDGSSLNLRHTTVMPNIDGFPMLMSLLFCPLVEIKPSADGTRVASILCGLGSQDDHKSLYPSHDISIILDTELTTEDTNKINELRYWMNMSIKYLETSYSGGNVPTTIEECQRELKLRLYELLKVQRKAVDRDFIPNASVWGKFLYDADLLQPGDSGIAEEIWPLHSGIKLNTKEHTELETHIIELENVAMNVQPITDLTCLFCQVKLDSVFNTRIHVTSKHHKDTVLAIMGRNPAP